MIGSTGVQLCTFDMGIKPERAGREKLGELRQRRARLGWLVSVHEGICLGSKTLIMFQFECQAPRLMLCRRLAELRAQDRSMKSGFLNMVLLVAWIRSMVVND